LLPAEYRQVKYIESSGTQYIDTGVVVTQEYFKIIDDIYIYSTTVQAAATFGKYSVYNYKLRTSYGNSLLYIYPGSSSIVAPLYKTSNIRAVHTAIIDNNSVTNSFGTTTTQATYNGTIVDGSSLFLFAYRNYNGSVSGHSIMRRYRCKMYTAEDVLARDFVPCYRIADTKPGLYDIVNNVFYINQGTGDDFIIGA